MQQLDEPQLVGFAGHETFPLRYGWLKKAVDATQNEHLFFSSPDAMVRLGVGKNMVTAIRYWGLATGILQPCADKCKNGIEPSHLGDELLSDEGLDPYLEDPATVWLLHWQLAGRLAGPTTWRWVFNYFRDSEFTKEKLQQSLEKHVETLAIKRVALSTLRRDIDCLIRTYVPSRTSRTVVLEETLDSPLTELHLIRETESGRLFAFGRGDHPTLPPAIVAYALLNHWQRTAPDSQTLTFDQVAYAPGSPGQVFKLTENSLVDYLEVLENTTDRAIVYQTTAGLRQLSCRKVIETISPVAILTKHYQRRTRANKR